jgi:hypothetical protein
VNGGSSLSLDNGRQISATQPISSRYGGSEAGGARRGGETGGKINAKNGVGGSKEDESAGCRRVELQVRTTAMHPSAEITHGTRHSTCRPRKRREITNKISTK